MYINAYSVDNILKMRQNYPFRPGGYYNPINGFFFVLKGLKSRKIHIFENEVLQLATNFLEKCCEIDSCCKY